MSLVSVRSEIACFSLRTGLRDLREELFIKMKVKNKTNTLRDTALIKAVKNKTRASKNSGESTLRKAVKNVKEVLEVKCHVFTRITVPPIISLISMQIYS